MLILSYDPITTEVIIKKVQPTNINLVGAAIGEFSLNGDLNLNDGYLTVDNSLTVNDNSTLDISDSSTLEII